MEAQWASRSQSREARRSRQRTADRTASRRADTRAAQWTEIDARQAACTACEAVDQMGDMYHGASGLVCAPCFAGGEGELVAPQDPGMVQQILMPFAYTPLLFPIPVWLSYGTLDPAQPFRGFDGLFTLWIALFFASWIYMPGLLVVLAARVRAVLRDVSKEPMERLALLPGIAWHGMGLLAIQAVMVAFLSLI